MTAETILETQIEGCGQTADEDRLAIAPRLNTSS
jgi:hypothetical protein